MLRTNHLSLYGEAFVQFIGLVFIFFIILGRALGPAGQRIDMMDGKADGKYFGVPIAQDAPMMNAAPVRQ